MQNTTKNIKKKLLTLSKKKIQLLLAVIETKHLLPFISKSILCPANLKIHSD